MTIADWFSWRKVHLLRKLIDESFDGVRLLIIANDLIPTLQMSILSPLAEKIDSGSCKIEYLFERDIIEEFGQERRSDAAGNWVRERLASTKPDFIIFCRYSGPHYDVMIEHARSSGIPSVYLIDDDLLNIPKEVGEKKYRVHNHPPRLRSVRYLLYKSSLVYCANRRLKDRLVELGIKNTCIYGKAFFAGEKMAAGRKGIATTIGYMGFDHVRDLQIVVPAIVQLLEEFPNLRFELLGSTPKPVELERFGERVSEIPAVREYAEFRQLFASLKWDIGLCPLTDSSFNRVKSMTKWIEYSSIGAAVVASRGRIYDDCCADECGILAADDVWYESIRPLLADRRKRLRIVRNAQRRLKREYSRGQQRDELLAVLRDAAFIQRKKWTEMKDLDSADRWSSYRKLLDREANRKSP